MPEAHYPGTSRTIELGDRVRVSGEATRIIGHVTEICHHKVGEEPYRAVIGVTYNGHFIMRRPPEQISWAPEPEQVTVPGEHVDTFWLFLSETLVDRDEYLSRNQIEALNAILTVNGKD